MSGSALALLKGLSARWGGQPVLLVRLTAYTSDPADKHNHRKLIDPISPCAPRIDLEN